jgi:purine/pyrimidine-nucleoside phosphorylase
MVSDMKHTLYFDGDVQSLRFKEGAHEMSVGVMAPGSYSFSSVSAESVEILSGSVEFRLESCSASRVISQGESYQVPPNTSFQIGCAEHVAYACHFINEL